MVDEKKTEEAPVEAPAPKELTKEDQAKSVITKYMWGNAVVGMLPIPILDIFTVGGVQFAMIKCISKIYGVEFKNDFMKPLIGAFVGAVGYDLVGKGICERCPCNKTQVGGRSPAPEERTLSPAPIPLS